MADPRKKSYERLLDWDVGGRVSRTHQRKTFPIKTLEHFMYLPAGHTWDWRSVGPIRLQKRFWLGYVCDNVTAVCTDARVESAIQCKRTA